MNGIENGTRFEGDGRLRGYGSGIGESTRARGRAREREEEEEEEGGGGREKTNSPPRENDISADGMAATRHAEMGTRGGKTNLRAARARE